MFHDLYLRAGDGHVFNFMKGDSVELGLTGLFPLFFILCLKTRWYRFQFSFHTGLVEGVGLQDFVFVNSRVGHHGKSPAVDQSGIAKGHATRLEEPKLGVSLLGPGTRIESCDVLQTSFSEIPDQGCPCVFPQQPDIAEVAPKTLRARPLDGTPGHLNSNEIGVRFRSRALDEVVAVPETDLKPDRSTPTEFVGPTQWQ